MRLRADASEQTDEARLKALVSARRQFFYIMLVVIVGAAVLELVS